MTLALTRAATATVVLLSVAAPGWAASADELDTLYEAIGTPRLIDIMRGEGIAQSVEDADAMFGRDSRGFADLASRVYDADRMEETFRADFDAILADTDVTPLLDFFASDRGRQIVSLELSAREALIDPEVEAAAERAAIRLADENPERLELIDSFINANDLIELNVMGTMNASVAYYQGLIEAGQGDVTESQILSDVWSREGEIRDSTTTWIYAYLGMAYEPLEDGDIVAYTDLGQTEAGRDLNRALFQGFGSVFEEISYLLGRATVTFGQSEEL